MGQYSANAGCPGCAHRWGTGSVLSQKNDLPIIGTRKPGTIDKVSIPGSKNISYDEIVKRMKELDENHPSIFFAMDHNAHNHHQL